MNSELRKNSGIALNIAIVAGMFAVFVGGWLVAKHFAFYTEGGIASTKLSAHSLAKIGLIIAELVMILVFTSLSLFLKTISSEFRRIGAVIAALFSFVSMALILIIYWGSVWYYVFDPSGNLKLSILIFVLAFVQGVCFVLEALKGK